MQILKPCGCKACGEWETVRDGKCFKKKPKCSKQGKRKPATCLEVKVCTACGLNFVSVGYCFFPATAKLQSPRISVYMRVNVKHHCRLHEIISKLIVSIFPFKDKVGIHAELL